MKAILKTGERSAVVVGPGTGIFATILWLSWIIYLLAAFVAVFALLLLAVIVLWINHDWKAYKFRKARRKLLS